MTDQRDIFNRWDRHISIHWIRREWYKLVPRDHPLQNVWCRNISWYWSTLDSKAQRRERGCLKSTGWHVTITVRESNEFRTGYTAGFVISSRELKACRVPQDVVLGEELRRVMRAIIEYYDKANQLVPV